MRRSRTTLVWVVAVSFSLVLAGFGTTSAVAAVDPHEPQDDAPPGATVLTWGVEIEGYLGHGGDIDFYKIEVPTAYGPHHVTVALDVPAGREYKASVGLSIPGGSEGIVWPPWPVTEPWAGRYQAESDPDVGGVGLYVMVSGVDDTQYSASAAYGLRVSWTNSVTGFPDVPVLHPYHDAIIGVAVLGYVTGYADGTFGPDDAVVRQQFAKVMALQRRLPVDESMVSPFTDLGADDQGSLYPHEYVAAVAAAGITNGTTPTTFSPWQKISLAQVVTMVTRAIDEFLPPVRDDYQPPFAVFDATHYPYARTAAYYGLLDGISEPYLWFAPASRGACVQVVWNVETIE